MKAVGGILFTPRLSAKDPHARHEMNGLKTSGRPPPPPPPLPPPPLREKIFSSAVIPRRPLEVPMTLCRNPSPDSACEADHLPAGEFGSHPIYPPTPGARQPENSECHRPIHEVSPQVVNHRMPSPTSHPPPPAPPHINLTTPSATVLTTWLDSDGDSGIMNYGDRLGSTSSSETEHSSSGFPDMYLARLHAKHLNRSVPRPPPPVTPLAGPLRADHSIPLTLRNPDQQMDRAPALPRTPSSHILLNGHPPQMLPLAQEHCVMQRQQLPLSVYKHSMRRSLAFPVASALSHQHSLSAVDVHSSWVDPLWRSTVNGAATRPLSLDGVHSAAVPYSYSRSPAPLTIGCTCHKACIRCGSKFSGSLSSKVFKRPLLRSASDIPSGLLALSPGIATSGAPTSDSPLRRMSTAHQGKSSLYVNVYENMSSSDGEDSVFHSEDMIKVHARPVSVIPESKVSTPRQAKSADAATRRRRLQKALSLASSLNCNDFVDVHAQVVSVIPSAQDTLVSMNLASRTCRASPVNYNHNPLTNSETTSKGNSPDHIHNSFDSQRNNTAQCLDETASQECEYSSYPLPPRPGTALYAPLPDKSICVYETSPASNVQHLPQSTASFKPDSKGLYGNPAAYVSPSGLSVITLDPAVEAHTEKDRDVGEVDDAKLKETSTKQSDTVAYAKVNKPQKGEKLGRNKKRSDATMDDSEPPLPPRNYRSEAGSSCKGHRSSLAERMHGLTRSAKEALRKAFSLDWLNERDNHQASGQRQRSSQKNQRNTKCLPAPAAPVTDPKTPLHNPPLPYNQWTPEQSSQHTTGLVTISDPTCNNYTEI